jgi:hypothetical protein
MTGLKLLLLLLPPHPLLARAAPLMHRSPSPDQL